MEVNVFGKSKRPSGPRPVEIINTVRKKEIFIFSR